MNEEIRALFNQYPDAKELYRDINGIVWVSKKTAETQSNGQKPETIKRSDYFKKDKK